MPRYKYSESEDTVYKVTDEGQTFRWTRRNGWTEIPPGSENGAVSLSGENSAIRIVMTLAQEANCPLTYMEIRRMYFQEGLHTQEIIVHTKAPKPT